MMSMQLAPTTWLHAVSALILASACTESDGADLAKIKLPAGFTITQFAAVPGARSLAMGDGGTVFVGTRDDKVFAVKDTDGDFKADAQHTIASGLKQPNGVALRDGALFVAEISRVIRYDQIESRVANPPEPKVVYDKFPPDTHHGWKFIAFGPDGKLYVPVGAPCNICDRGDRYAAIFRLNADGSGLERFASGIRNTVGFDWHPTTRELWFTDNGRDNLGNTIPPDELNHAARAGLDFGYPRCHGKDIRDPEFGTPNGCASQTSPEVLLDAHIAALGLRFYTGKQFPTAYRHAIFIAEHGSWNRQPPLGYRIEVVTFDKDNQPTRSTFAEGWLPEGSTQAWGRPVDVLIYTDGSLLVSDDHAGAIYRIAYAAP